MNFGVGGREENVDVLPRAVIVVVVVAAGMACAWTEI